MLRNAVAFAAIALSVLSAEASPSECVDGGIGEQHECVGTKLAQAEIELKKIVQVMIEKLSRAKTEKTETTTLAESREAHGRLVKSQAAWNGHRDADCALKGLELLGGPGHDLLVATCQLDQTDARIKELRSLGI